MKRLLIATTALTLLAAPLSGAFAQGRSDRYDDHRPNAMMVRHDNDRFDRHDNGRHNGWHKGGRIERRDWDRGVRVDYRRYHLSQPPRGYEWRRVDNSYVLAAAATGLIAGLVLASH
ncbi:MAG TPA: RcnB family protein [Rhizomicrobium sp.]|nr:RcnB family protein [Rhizomicrobium sp.]